MEHVSGWLQGLAEMQANLIAYAPNFLAAVALLLLGWGLARLARAGVRRLGGGFNRLLEKALHISRFSRVQLSPRLPELFASIAFWLVILIFVTAASRAAHLDAFSEWLHSIVAYLPNLLAGGLILLVGYVVGAMVRDLVAGTLSSAGFRHGETAGAVSQGAILLFAAVVGIDQIGVDVTFLITVVAVVTTALLGGIALAFGIGAQTLVGNLIGAHYLQQQVQPGQRVRLGDTGGEVLELTATSVILTTPQGRVVVPAKLFNEVPTVILAEEQADE